MGTIKNENMLIKSAIIKINEDIKSNKDMYESIGVIRDLFSSPYNKEKIFDNLLIDNLINCLFRVFF